MKPKAGTPESRNEPVTKTESSREYFQPEELYEAVLKSSFEAIYILEAFYDDQGEVVDFIFRDVNEKGLQQLSVQREELVGRKICEKFPVNRENGFFEQYKKVFLKKTPLLQEYQLPPEYNMPGWFRHQVVPMARGVVIYNGDVTEEKQALLETKHRAKMLSQTEKIAKIGSWEWEVATDTVTWSDELFRILQRDPRKGAISYADHYKLYPEHDFAMLKEAVSKALKKGTPYELELNYVLPGGEVRRCRTWGHARYTGNEVTHLYGSLQDIHDEWLAKTERKTLEQQLQQAQKMEALGNMAGGIAHDFNNLLQVILPMIELSLARISPGSVVAENLERALAATTMSVDLVKKITAFARGNPGHYQPCNLINIIKDCRELLEKISGPHRLQVTLDEEALFCVVDKVEIEQILINLVTNAAQAMEGLKGTIRLSVHSRHINIPTAGLMSLEPGSYVSLEVADSGPGIDDAVKSRIFEPFFTTKASDKGSGLGLAIVHTIVKNSRGAIRVSDNEPAGARFEILLPRSDSPPGYFDQLPAGSPAKARKLKILLLDDNHEVGNAKQQVLTQLGHTVRLFFSPLEALRHFKENRAGFDLVMTDLSMPELDGHEFSKMVEELKSGLPIIIYSGLNATNDLLTWAEQPNHAFLRKPIAIQTLHEKIAEIITTP